MLANAENNRQKYRTFWEDRFGPINWELVFKSLFSRDEDRKACNLQWKLIQLVIPTAECLCRHKVIDNPVCTRCQSDKETTLHLFLYCPTVLNLWKKAAHLISSINPLLDLDDLEHFVVIGFTNLKNNPYLLPVNAVRDIALTSVWMSRNKLVFDNENVDVTSLFTSRLQRRIKEAFFIAKSSFEGLFNFTEIWCRNRALCYIENDKLILTI